MLSVKLQAVVKTQPPVITTTLITTVKIGTCLIEKNEMIIACPQIYN